MHLSNEGVTVLNGNIFIISYFIIKNLGTEESHSIRIQMKIFYHAYIEKEKIVLTLTGVAGLSESNSKMVV